MASAHLDIVGEDAAGSSAPVSIICSAARHHGVDVDAAMTSRIAHRTAIRTVEGRVASDGTGVLSTAVIVRVG